MSETAEDRVVLYYLGICTYKYMQSTECILCRRSSLRQCVSLLQLSECFRKYPISWIWITLD